MPVSDPILVIEDNDFVRMQIVKFLQDGGYTTLEGNSVESGVALVHQHEDKIACMLVDVRMEPEDGFDFINKVRAENLGIPYILVTGDSNPDILAKASSIGVASVLMKPVNKDRLLKMVERVIATKGGH